MGRGEEFGVEGRNRKEAKARDILSWSVDNFQEGQLRENSVLRRYCFGIKVGKYW